MLLPMKPARRLTQCLAQRLFGTVQQSPHGSLGLHHLLGRGIEVAIVQIMRFNRHPLLVGQCRQAFAYRFDHFHFSGVFAACLGVIVGQVLHQ